MRLGEWAQRWNIPAAALQELEGVLWSPTLTLEGPVLPGTEAAVQQDLRLAAPHLGCLLWRNNVGVLPDARGVPVRYGLCNDSKRVNDRVKSSDLVGLAPDGRFLAVEVKSKGWKYRGNPREEAQKRFLNLVQVRGGIGLFATSISDLERALQ